MSFRLLIAKNKRPAGKASIYMRNPKWNAFIRGADHQSSEEVVDASMALCKAGRSIARVGRVLKAHGSSFAAYDGATPYHELYVQMSDLSDVYFTTKKALFAAKDAVSQFDTDNERPLTVENSKAREALEASVDAAVGEVKILQKTLDGYEASLSESFRVGAHSMTFTWDLYKALHAYYGAMDEYKVANDDCVAMSDAPDSSSGDEEDEDEEGYMTSGSNAVDGTLSSDSESFYDSEDDEFTVTVRVH